jgi:DnaJ-class molecular chaperone
MTYPCHRCAGSGRIKAFSHVLAGVCFKCGGSGRQKRKPGKPSVLWAVLFRNGATGQMDRIYNLRGKTPEQVRRKAENTYPRASADFRQTYNLDTLQVVRDDELPAQSA